MSSADATRFVAERSVSGFHVRLLLAWGCVIAAAFLYCVLHGLVAGDFSFQPGVTARWALVNWGAWPLLLPLCYWLIRIVERRASLGVGVLAAAPVAVLGSAVFALVADRALGGEWTLTAAIYYMAPIAFGTYLLFVAVGFWLLNPSVLSAATKEARAVDDSESMALPVWKGQVRTTIESIDIEWARAARNYVEFFVGDDAFIMRASMAELERMLPDEQFLRAHRSYLVNRARIAGIHGGRARPSIVVTSGAKIPVGKTYRRQVLEEIEERAAV